LLLGGSLIPLLIVYMSGYCWSLGQAGETMNGAAAAEQTKQSSSSKNVLRVAVGSSNPTKLRAVEEALRRRPGDGATTTDDDSTTIIEYDVQGFAVESGVNHQPFGNSDTRRGAKNRAKAAYAAYRKLHGRPPHLAVGMEGGLEWIADDNEDDNVDNDDDNDETNGNIDRKNGEEQAKNKNKTLYCMAWMAIYGRRQALTVDLFASEDTQTYHGDKVPIFGLAKTASFALPPAITKLVVNGNGNGGMELGEADDLVFHRVNSKHGNGTVGILTNGRVDRASYYEHALQLALTPWIRPDIFPHGSTTT
jgi:inosine/xanthosine triphosphatase